MNKTSEKENKMEITLREADKNMLAPLRKLYRKSFPCSEKKPFSMIIRKRNEGKAEILAAVNGAGEFCGLMITAIDGEYVLLDYFAVEPDKRGGGIGSALLEMLRERYEGKKIFLEIERVESKQGNLEQKQRRKRFYKRCGLSETGLYTDLAGVEMEILSFGCEMSFVHYYEFYEHYLGRLAKKIVKPLNMTQEARQ